MAQGKPLSGFNYSMKFSSDVPLENLLAISSVCSEKKKPIGQLFSISNKENKSEQNLVKKEFKTNGKLQSAIPDYAPI